MAEVIKMPGTVRSVNGIKPDENANVTLPIVSSVNGIEPDAGGNVALPTKTEPENVRYVSFWVKSKAVGSNDLSNNYYTFNVIIPSALDFAKEVLYDRSYIMFLGYVTSSPSSSLTRNIYDEYGKTGYNRVNSFTVVENSSNSTSFPNYPGYGELNVSMRWPRTAFTENHRIYSGLVTLAYVPVDETSES